MCGMISRSERIIESGGGRAVATNLPTAALQGYVKSADYGPRSERESRGRTQGAGGGKIGELPPLLAPVQQQEHQWHSVAMERIVEP